MKHRQYRMSGKDIYYRVRGIARRMHEEHLEEKELRDLFASEAEAMDLNIEDLERKVRGAYLSLLTFYRVRNLAHDLRHEGYSHKELAAICERESEDLNIDAKELHRKVEAAYQSLFIYDHQEEDRDEGKEQEPSNEGR